MVSSGSLTKVLVTGAGRQVDGWLLVPSSEGADVSEEQRLDGGSSTRSAVRHQDAESGSAMERELAERSNQPALRAERVDSHA